MSLIFSPDDVVEWILESVATEDVWLIIEKLLHKTNDIMDTQRIGKKALKAHRFLYDITKNMRNVKDLRDQFAEMYELILIVESTIAGTEYEELFALKMKKREKNLSIAFRLHVSERTVSRMLNVMEIHIGQSLMKHTNVEKILKLLSYADAENKGERHDQR